MAVSYIFRVYITTPRTPIPLLITTYAISWTWWIRYRAAVFISSFTHDCKVGRCNTILLFSSPYPYDIKGDSPLPKLSWRILSVVLKYMLLCSSASLAGSAERRDCSRIVLSILLGSDCEYHQTDTHLLRYNYRWILRWWVYRSTRSPIVVFIAHSWREHLHGRMLYLSKNLSYYLWLILIGVALFFVYSAT